MSFRRDLEGQEVWLIFFDGEDSGGLDGWEWSAGAAAFAADLTVTPQAVVILDMVGDADLQIRREATSDATLLDEIWSIADTWAHRPSSRRSACPIIDDHRPFLDRGIPAVDIIDLPYAYWHTTADTLDKISAESLGPGRPSARSLDPFPPLALYPNRAWTYTPRTRSPG